MIFSLKQPGTDLSKLSVRLSRRSQGDGSAEIEPNGTDRVASFPVDFLLETACLRYHFLFEKNPTMCEEEGLTFAAY